MTSNLGGNSKQSTVRQTIVETLEAPRLQGIETRDFVLFKDKRSIYDRQVKEKESEEGVKICATSYRNSIDRPILQLLILANWVPVDDIESITERHLKDCIEKQSKCKDTEYDLAQVEGAIKSIRMDKGKRLEVQVWKLGLKYIESLQNIGYPSFVSKYSHIAIDHILHRVNHEGLRKRMLLIYRLQKENLKKNFKLFLQTLAEEAKAVDKHEMALAATKETLEGLQSFSKPLEQSKNNQAGTIPDSRSKYKKGPAARSVRFNVPSKKHDESGGTTTTKGSKRKRPSCLNPICNEYHYMSECEKTSEEEKTRLINSYRSSKQRKGNNGKAVSNITDNCDENSSLFSATFLNGNVKVNVLADQGADINIIPINVYDEMVKFDSSLDATVLGTTQYYGTAHKNGPSIPCSRTITTSVNLMVRHASSLELKDIDWMISDTEVRNVIIGRGVLSAIGLDNRRLLAAAAEKFDGVVNIPDLMKDNSKEIREGSIQSLIRESECNFGGTFHSSNDENEGIPEDESIFLDIGEDDRDEVEKELRNRVEKARENGLSSKGCHRLSKILEKNKLVFRIRLGKSEPAKIEPMRIRTHPGSKSVRMKARRYTEDQRKFLDKYINSLIKAGFVEERATASWQAAPLLIQKQNSRSGYRMTVDLRPINAATIKESWPMPNLDSEILDFKDSTCYAGLDFITAYWQLPLHTDSKDLCGIVTPNRVVVACRVLQGLANGTSFFQGSIEPLFATLREWLKAWLDDFVLHDKTENGLLDHIEEFLTICAEKNLFLSAVKCNFYLQKIRWCGRIIDSKGYIMDPQRYEAITTMEEPKTAAELCEFVLCCRWMAAAIPNFQEKAKLLTEILEKAYERSKKRTKKSIKSIELQKLSWGTQHTIAFNELKNSICSRVKLSYPKTDFTICIFTDASQYHWSGVVTQVVTATLGKEDIEKQDHEPLAFLGSSFKKSELNWSTFDKEAYAIYSTFKKLDYMLLSGCSIRVFTDHRNLIYVFAPLAIEPMLGRHIVSKVQRWALFLSKFQYVISHIKGEANLFADILTRWAKGYRSTKAPNMSICSICTDYAEQVIPAADKISWPDVNMIRQSQKSYYKNDKNVSLCKVDNLYKVSTKIWIPAQDAELQLKILVVSHCGVTGHRGIEGTKSILREQFYWSGMDDDVDELVKTCLHCIVSRAGNMIPRPLSHALHGETPNEVVHMDFLFMGTGSDNKKYCLILKDDLSSYCWLFACEAATSEATADSLLSWIASFGTMDWIISDQGSHFKNMLINELANELHNQHHFTTAYSPWANGTIERMCREVKRACTALCSEWKLGAHDWPMVIETVQSLLNQAPLKRLGLKNPNDSGVFRTPLEVFTGIKPKRPLLRALPLSEFTKSKNINEARVKQLISIESLQQALENVHRNVEEVSTASRRKQVERHNLKTNVKPVNFHMGDFVLVRRPKPPKHKLTFMWVGPRRIVGVNSNLVYTVKDLIKNQTEVVHARRLLLYKADMDGVDVSPELLSMAKHLEADYQEVCSIRDIRDENKELQILIEWKGLPDSPDYTWESLSIMNEDIPDLVQEFLKTSGKNTLKKEASKQCSF